MYYNIQMFRADCAANLLLVDKMEAAQHSGYRSSFHRQLPLIRIMAPELFLKKFPTGNRLLLQCTVITLMQLIKPIQYRLVAS